MSKYLDLVVVEVVTRTNSKLLLDMSGPAYCLSLCHFVM